MSRHAVEQKNVSSDVGCFTALFVSRIIILQTLSIKKDFLSSLLSSYISLSPLTFLILCFPFACISTRDLFEREFTNSSEHQKVPGSALAAIREVRFIEVPK